MPTKLEVKNHTIVGRKTKLYDIEDAVYLLSATLSSPNKKAQKTFVNVFRLSAATLESEYVFRISKDTIPAFDFDDLQISDMATDSQNKIYLSDWINQVVFRIRYSKDGLLDPSRYRQTTNSTFERITAIHPYTRHTYTFVATNNSITEVEWTFAKGQIKPTFVQVYDVP